MYGWIYLMRQNVENISDALFVRFRTNQRNILESYLTSLERNENLAHKCVRGLKQNDSIKLGIRCTYCANVVV